MPGYVFIGYRTVPVSDKKLAARGKPGEVTAPAPYLTTLENVFLADEVHSKTMEFKRDQNGALVSTRVRSYLARQFGEIRDKKDRLTFVGFDPRLLLHILALEASLPGQDKPIPFSLYTAMPVVDIGDVVLPKEYRDRLSLVEAVTLRRPVDDVEGKAWDRQMKDWTGPGASPQADVWLTLNLKKQFGL